MSALDQLDGLRDDALDYLRLRWTALRLRIADRLSASLSKMVGWVLCLWFVVIAIVFLMVALALWIGQALDNPALGFLIAGGGFLVLGVVLFFVGRAVASGALVRHFVGMFFFEDDYYGTRD